MNQEYISIEDAKKIANYDKLLAERDMYKSDNYILRNKSKENDKKYLKIIEEKSDAAKSYYNKYTTSLNLLIKKFPSNIIARIHGIEERFYFDNKNMNDNDILDFKL